jgi:hypothetical protein
MAGLGFGAVAALTASTSIPMSLPPSCSRTETVLHGDFQSSAIQIRRWGGARRNVCEDLLTENAHELVLNQRA